MSELIKLSYRGIGGFVVLLLVFIFGVVGFALAVSGGLITALCWTPLAFPEVIDYSNVEIWGRAVSDPVFITGILLLIGLILLAVGFFFLALAFTIGKASFIVDKELSQAVDRAFGTPRERRDDRIYQLERLAALRDRSVITPEEFEQEKAKIMEQQ